MNVLLLATIAIVWALVAVVSPAQTRAGFIYHMNDRPAVESYQC